MTIALPIADKQTLDLVKLDTESILNNIDAGVMEYDTPDTEYLSITTGKSLTPTLQTIYTFEGCGILYDLYITGQATHWLQRGLVLKIYIDGVLVYSLSTGYNTSVANSSQIPRGIQYSDLILNQALPFSHTIAGASPDAIVLGLVRPIKFQSGIIMQAAVKNPDSSMETTMYCNIRL